MAAMVRRVPRLYASDTVLFRGMLQPTRTVGRRYLLPSHHWRDYSGDGQALRAVQTDTGLRGTGWTGVTCRGAWADWTAALLA